MKEIITLEELVREYSTWYQSDSPLRFGQYIFNKYFSEPWPELFYEEDEERAFALIANQLVAGTTPEVIDYTGDFPELKQGELKPVKG